MDNAITRGIVRALEAVAALALLLLMVLVFVDVVGRNMLNRPVPWSTEMLEIIVATMIFLLYPVLALQGGHITVDLIPFPKAVQRVQRVLGAVVGAIVFGVITFCLARQANRVLGYGEASPILGIPLGWVLWVMCVLAGLCTVAFVISAVHALRGTQAGAASAGGSN